MDHGDEVLVASRSNLTGSDMRPRLITIKEAAGYLSVSVSTLYGWVCSAGFHLSRWAAR